MNVPGGPRVLFTSALILAAYVSPFFHLRRWGRLSGAEAAALSFAASSLYFGGAAFVTHTLGVNQPLAHGLLLGVLFLSILPAIPGMFSRYTERDLWLLLSYPAFLLLILLLQAAFPIYVGGYWYFDWWQHYNLSQMYMGKVPHDYLWLGMYNFASRTPLMNLNAAFFLSIFGDNYWIYQVVASILNSIFFLPVYLLCRELVDKRTAMMIGALLFLSPSLIHNTWYPWPKLFAAYFVLLAAYFYLTRRKQGDIPDTSMCILVFALIWAGFLAHQSSLFSSGVILIDMFVRVIRKEPRRFLPLGMACAACFIVIDGIWFAWATSFFGIKHSFLSYYERPASIGGLSGYLILFTYHTLATMCSPLFLYDLGARFEITRFFENVQVLYYNSLIGFATITIFLAALAVLIGKMISRRLGIGYVQYARGHVVRRLLALLSIWDFVIGGMILFFPGFGQALFSHYFNHPDFARKMFEAFFLGGGVALGTASVILSLFSRQIMNEPRGQVPDFAISLLFWMTIAGYAGGIATHHELYIHGMVSAGSATAVLLTVFFLARVCSDMSRTWRFFVAVPIFCENFAITWLPLLIIKYNWGWAGEKNWELKARNLLVFMADLFPNAWWKILIVGALIQASMLIVWLLQKNGGEVEGRP